MPIYRLNHCERARLKIDNREVAEVGAAAAPHDVLGIVKVVRDEIAAELAVLDAALSAANLAVASRKLCRIREQSNAAADLTAAFLEGRHRMFAARARTFRYELHTQSMLSHATNERSDDMTRLKPSRA